MPPVGESRASRARGSISAWPLPSPTYPHAVGPGASLAEVFEASRGLLLRVARQGERVVGVHLWPPISDKWGESLLVPRLLDRVRGLDRERCVTES